MAYILAAEADQASGQRNAAPHNRLCGAALAVSGQRDSNSQPSAWESGAPRNRTLDFFNRRVDGEAVQNLSGLWYHNSVAQVAEEPS